MTHRDEWAPERASSQSVENVVFLGSHLSSRTTSNWKEGIENKLCLFKQGQFDDYETQIPAGSVIFTHARALLAALSSPIIAPPILGINDEGTLLLEWHKIEDKKSTIFSLILDGENLIYSIMLMGLPETYGALLFSEDSLDIVNNLLLKYFVVQTHARRARR